MFNVDGFVRRKTRLTKHKAIDDLLSYRHVNEFIGNSIFNDYEIEVDYVWNVRYLYPYEWFLRIQRSVSLFMQALETETVSDIASLTNS